MPRCGSTCSAHGPHPSTSLEWWATVMARCGSTWGICRKRGSTRSARATAPSQRPEGRQGPPPVVERLVGLVEVVREYLVCHLRPELGSVFDGGAIVDPAPDPGVPDLAGEILHAVEVAIAETRDAGNRVVDLVRAEETGDHASP